MRYNFALKSMHTYIIISNMYEEMFGKKPTTLVECKKIRAEYSKTARYYSKKTPLKNIKNYNSDRSSYFSKLYESDKVLFPENFVGGFDRAAKILTDNPKIFRRMIEPDSLHSPGCLLHQLIEIRYSDLPCRFLRNGFEFPEELIIQRQRKFQLDTTGEIFEVEDLSRVLNRIYYRYNCEKNIEKYFLLTKMGLICDVVNIIWRNIMHVKRRPELWLCHADGGLIYEFHVDGDKFEDLNYYSI